MKGRTATKQPVSTQDETRAAQLRKVEALVRDTGIAVPWAWSVVRGQLSLNEVLLRMSQQDKVSSIVSRHGVDKALATQVAKGQLELELLLRRKREKDHLALHLGRDPLGLAAENGTAMRLYLHGLRQLDGTVSAVDAFEFDLSSAEGSQRLHKLQVKLMHPASMRGTVGQSSQGRSAAEPIPRPQERFALSNRRLFEAHDAGRTCRVESLEGDELRGLVTWVGRYEFGLGQSGGAELVVMRHAIRQFEEI